MTFIFLSRGDVAGGREVLDGKQALLARIEYTLDTAQSSGIQRVALGLIALTYAAHAAYHATPGVR